MVEVGLFHMTTGKTCCELNKCAFVCMCMTGSQKSVSSMFLTLVLSAFQDNEWKMKYEESKKNQDEWKMKLKKKWKKMEELKKRAFGTGMENEELSWCTSNLICGELFCWGNVWF